MPTTYKLIQGDSVLVTQPILIQHYGRVGASLIQQIYYWSQKGQGVVYDNQRWIHNTVEQWAEQLCVSASTIKRTVQKLIQDGAIRVLKLSKHKSNQTNSYTLNLDRLKDLMEKKISNKEESIYRSGNTCETHIVYEDGRKTHRVKMTHSSVQNEPMVIQKIPHKDKNNKSRTHEEKKHKRVRKEIQQVQTQPALGLPAQASSHLTASEYIQSPNGLEKGKERSSTVQDMIEIWNNEVSVNKKQISTKLNRAISKYLVACYKYKFNNNLDAWKRYCKLITSSPYLMSKDFVLSLNWAVKYTTIDRILAGELGVELRPVPEQPKSQEDMRAEALRHIDGVGESEGCKEVRRTILAAVGATHYNAWFTKVDILDDGATLKPHNRFVEAAIAARFGDVLERLC